VNPNVACRSNEPATFKHDEATVQVPTALPPQAVTLLQEAPVPPVPVPVPAVPVELLPAVELPVPAVELPAPPAGLPVPPEELPVPAAELPGPPELVVPHATTTKTAAVAGRNEDRTFIERGLPKSELQSSSY
jgi:hypothetical protein